jgi:hypothetical protein
MTIGAPREARRRQLASTAFVTGTSGGCRRVSVRVSPSDAPPALDADLRAPADWVAAAAPADLPVDEVSAQQQQQ